MTPLPKNFGAKLGAWDPVQGWSPVEHQNTYCKESISGVSRLLVASKSPTDLLRQSLPLYGEKFKVVYLLVTPPEGYEPSRYEVSLGLDQIHELLNSFEAFLGSDARHHVWFHSLEPGGGTIIWDEHNWLYYYGRLDQLEQSLTASGYHEQKPEIPFPHLHNESAENNPIMEQLLSAYPWVQVPVSNL